MLCDDSGRTVSAIGSHLGLKNVRKIVEDCMKNIHPIYNIKTLMIKRELMKDEKLKDENWTGFCHLSRKGKLSNPPKVLVSLRRSRPLDGSQRVDLQLESGEYFLNEQDRRKQKNAEKEAKQAEHKQKRKQERAAQLIAPAELARKKRSAPVETGVKVDIKRLKKKAAKTKKS
uniref:KRR1 small subunit processome component second KH domain-containing protein n=1 Tax=Ditylenchus dipsaci TaxID=166011 RepID=A0A915ENP2_9BILA